ncbi:hypothetical protein GO755_20635 [Spirosoma sp. HMF4905]|uniref:Uncharacterized protein n=1 Tax=Spirosoma arboris TaxID=2682092 RepID=A0A7K1SFG0_9BACT|nr:hypothetical protein [Spirosoma arboris]MVM32464.1 hypothetical protein [Spirosoma arboris]
MTSLYFSCISPMGKYHEFGYGGPDMEACFETLTKMANRGWRLKNIVLSESDGSHILLPAKAFGGASLMEPLKALQQEWEQILFQV